MKNSYLNNIYNKDVLEVLKKLTDNSLDLIYGDPDYNVGVNYAGNNYTKKLNFLIKLLNIKLCYFQNRLNFIIIIIFTFLINQNLHAQWPMMKMDADSMIQIGKDYIYNLQFDKAEEQFNKVIKDYPNHPAGYFLNAMVDWWKINLNQKDNAYDESFLEKINRVIDVSDRLLDSNSQDIKALFFRGGAIGYRARFYVLRKDYLKAAKDGNQGLNILIECLKVAPQNYDIMLGTGIYNYFSVALQDEYPALKPLMTFYPSGDKKLGILQLTASANNARYANVEAKVVLLQIYYQYEFNYVELLKISNELNNKYPSNPLFMRYLARAYNALGNFDKADILWRKTILMYMDHQPGYDAYSAREALYYIGNDLFYYKKDYKMALKYFLKCDEACIFLDEKPSGFRAAANIKIAKLYDLLGKREEAIKYYKIVLDITDFDNSHNEAKKYLEKPYSN